MENYSFLMSVYYKEKPEFLKLSIESILNQTIEPTEIIIVKDGLLTPQLDALINMYSSKDKRFHIIALPSNGGLGNALNVGLAQCQNELVARMDSDDICKKDRCEKMLKKFESVKNLVILGTQIDEFSEDIGDSKYSRIVPTKYEDILRFARRRCPFNHPTVMYKKSIVLKEGGYPSSGRKEDLDLFLGLLSKGYYAENLSESLLFYRANLDNTLRRRTWKNNKEYIQIIKKYWKVGFCHFSDYLFVLFSQLVFFIVPAWLFKIINKKLLRRKVDLTNKKKTV